jgi:Protein of unknown function (DUF3179)
LVKTDEKAHSGSIMTKCFKSLACKSCSVFLLLGILLAVFPLPEAQANPELWRQRGWSKTDFSKTSIKFDEILSGGPPKDGIPSIDKPIFKPLGEIKSLGNKEPVITLQIGGEARAYPLRILIWHEIVNDVIAGTPVAVTYCPLCNSAIVFDRTINGKVHDFGTTGKLRNSDMVMYDRQTQSWWQQFSGEAIVGSMLGTKLDAIPARLEAFELFAKRYPDGKVLVPNNPRMRNYGRNPYVGYDSAARPFLYRGEMPQDINPMVRVVAVKVNGKPRAVSLGLIVKKRRIELGDVVLTWTPGQNSALDRSAIKNSKDVGNVVVQRKTPKGLKDTVYDVTFAFVFNAFHPGRSILQE